MIIDLFKCYESDTSDALGHAFAMEVRSTFEVGQSSTTPRVSPAEHRAELSRLREDISWCRGRYVSMSRRLCERQSDVKGLRREVKHDSHKINILTMNSIKFQFVEAW
jgi:hypothetical protein